MHRKGKDQLGSADDGRLSAEALSASPSEWAVAVVSAMVVFGSVGFVLYKAVTLPDTPAVIELEVEDVVDTGNQYVVEFWAYNHGGTTASGLVVEGEVRSPEGTSLEVRQMTFNFVPTESRRLGGLYFSVDPRENELVMRAVGYDRP